MQIDGLGTFRSGPGGRLVFRALPRSRVFLAYVQEDSQSALRLYHWLRQQGLEPWMDKQKLLPGQNWPRAIEHAIEASDFFVACFSQRAVSKRGQFQAELRYALDCAARLPLEQIYLIPVRLEECQVPLRISRQFQYLDLFPDWDKGARRLAAAMRRRSAGQQHRAA